MRQTEPIPGASAQTSRLRKTSYRAFAVVFSCVISLALGEIAVRVLDVPPRALMPLIETPDGPMFEIGDTYLTLSENPVLKYEYRPGFSADTFYEGDHWGFQINEDGFRDRIYDRAKPADTVRIVVLGDSITAGNGIEQLENTYTKKLEKLLNASSNGSEFQVLNMGVSGYQTCQEVELLRVRGLAYDPDVVIVGFCLNDFWWDADGGVEQRLKALELVKNQPRPASADSKSKHLLHWTLSRSRLALVCYHHLQNSLWRQSFATAQGNSGESDQSPDEVGFAQLAKLQEEHGFRCYVFVIPAFYHSFSSYHYQHWHQRVDDLAKKYPNITTIDLVDDFQKINDNAPVFSSDGVHPNDYGHGILAEIIRDHLEF